MHDITVAELALAHSGALAHILSTDERLHHELNPQGSITNVGPQEYFDTCVRWAERRNGRCYAILLGEQPIGSISLCDIDYEKRVASVGYWLASGHWGNGYATKAFARLIAEATNMTIAKLTCCISPDNVASLAMWKRLGALLTDDNGMIRPWLSINPETQL